MRTLVGLLLSWTMAFVPKTFAQDKKTDVILDPLNEQIKLIEVLEPTVERVDLARLLVIKKMLQIITEDVKTNRNGKRKEVTFQTLRLIQGLIIQYRFSKVFFGWSEPRSLTSIYTENTAETLQKLKQLSEEVVSEYGYDDSPYTQITANTFKQMQKLLKVAEDLSFDNKLKTQMRSLWRPIGEVIAIAEQGDRPKAFALSVPLVKSIREMYPMFDAISSSNAGFQVILELQGLTEFYAEFAQME